MSLEQFLAGFQDTTEVFSARDIFLTILLSFLLSMLIAWVYKMTYSGTSYTQSYVHTLIIMAVVVGVIMLIIGSNIARAFSLVGALSIIRFRNAVKDTRDVGYIFFAMAIGMACGTRFYGIAIISTLLICFMLWGLSALDMFARDESSQILKIRLPADVDFENLFDGVFLKYLAVCELIEVETVQAGMLTELVYRIRFRKSASAQAFMGELRQLNDNNKIALLTGYQETDL